MYRYQLYKIQEIEDLKRELEFYRSLAESSPTRNMIGDHQEAKSDDYQSQLEGEVRAMEEKYENKGAEYEQEENNISAKVNTVDDSIHQLKEEIHDISDKVEQTRLTELLEEMNDMLEKQTDLLKDGKSEMDQLKADVLQLKERAHSSDQKPDIQHQPQQQQPSSQLDYRKLKSMLHAPKHIEQVPNRKKKIQ